MQLRVGQRRASETRVRTVERCVTRYVIAGGDALDSWILTSTSANGDSKRNMSLDGDDVLLEFLRSVMAKGGCLVIELPASESEEPKSTALRTAHNRNAPKGCK
jgi:hypothetical protein